MTDTRGEYTCPTCRDLLPAAIALLREVEYGQGACIWCGSFPHGHDPDCKLGIVLRLAKERGL